MKTINLKSNQRALVVSDIHIGNGVNNQDKLLSLLDEYDFVVFNGDIFELFIHSVHRMFNIADKLFLWMYRNQHKFAFVVGNHDEKLWAMEDELFFPLYTACKVVQKKQEFVITHGHQFDPRNRKTTLKNKILFALEALANLIFRTNWQHLIFRKKRFFYKYADRKRKEGLPTVRKNAEAYAISTGAEYLIHGHTHFATENRYSSKTCVIDQGGFQIGMSYVEIENGKANLIIAE